MRTKGKPHKPPPQCVCGGRPASFCHTWPILRSQVAKCQRPSSSPTKGRSCSPYTPSQESSCFLSCCQGNHQLHLCVTGLQGLAVPETNVTQKESDLKAQEPRDTTLPYLKRGNRCGLGNLPSVTTPQVVSWDVRLCCANTILPCGVLSLGSAVSPTPSLLLG